MSRRVRNNVSISSPKRSKRGCLCPDGTYSSKCCDGSLWAQGIGVITGSIYDLVSQEGNNYLFSQDGQKIIAQ